MILFACLKKEFMEYVKDGVISDKVYEAYKEKYQKKTKYNQIKAWANSLPIMSQVIDQLPDNTGIILEYNIPLTSKSIDMIITGYDSNKKPIILIIELKQWSYSKLIKAVDGVVRTKINSQEKNVLHPAYQVLSYAQILNNYNINIEKEQIKIIPLVVLHNYELEIDDVLYNKKYKPY